MSQALRTKQAKTSETALDLAHLRRETRTALELAIVALAPSDLIDSLAVSAGLLEALVGLPTDSAPVVALVPAVAKRAKGALESWSKWQNEYLEKRIPRG
jgi:hypothetical protein